jgi:LETM1-like protein
VQLLADRVTEKTQVALRKNLDRIVNEVRETQELYALLMKSRSETLSPEEKEKVRAQLYDIMKTIPTLAIFALPGGSIALPILIRLLPFNLLPSSFED